MPIIKVFQESKFFHSVTIKISTNFIQRFKPSPNIKHLNIWKPPRTLAIPHHLPPSPQLSNMTFNMLYCELSQIIVPFL